MAATPAADRYLARDGARLRYRDEGAGPALVLLHGWLLDLTVWDRLLPGWSRHFRVLRLDRRGFGASTGTPGLAADALDVLALLDELGVARAAVLGQSQGARVALELARCAAGRVDALVLDGAPAMTGLPGGPWTEQETPLAHYRALLRTDGPVALRAALAANPLMRLRTPDPAARDALDAMLAGYSGADLDAPGAEVGVAGAFDGLDRPVLVLNGAHDTVQRLAAGAALARAIAGARRLVIPGAGHLACLDEPGRYGGLVTEFLLARIPTSATQRTEPS